MAERGTFSTVVNTLTPIVHGPIGRRDCNRRRNKHANAGTSGITTAELVPAILTLTLNQQPLDKDGNRSTVSID